MNGRRLLTLSTLALLFACEDQKNPTGPTGLTPPTDPSAIISDGAHGGNPDFFFLPPMVPLASRNPNFELGKFNNALKPSLKIQICELASTPVNAQGLPRGDTPCAGSPIKTFAPGTVKLVNLPRRENGWWNFFGLPADGFYYVLWDTRQSNLNVNKYYRIKVLIAGSPDFLLGIADVDPMSSLRQWKYSLTGDVIQLIDDVLLPIPFRVERNALCTDVTLCASATITNHTADGSDQFVRVQGADGSFIAGVQIPDGWLPANGPQNVVFTIRRVNTGVNNVAAGTQTIPCHTTNLPLQQFNGCFNFSTIPELPIIPESGGHQFLKEITAAVCFVLVDAGEIEDFREPWVQLWSSEAGGADAKALPSAPDAQILSEGTGRNCGNNLVGFNNKSSGFRGLASAGWDKLKSGLGRVFGVQTAYAVDLGLGGLSFDLSNIGPALTARIERYTNTGLTLGAGATTTSTVRIVGTQKHDHSGLLPTGIGGLSVKFKVVPGNGTLRLLGSEAPPDTVVTSITNTNPIVAGSATSGGGFAPVNWTMPSTPGTYTLTATGTALGGPITFTATVPPVVGFNFLPGSVRAGTAHTCGLATGGAAYCWGNNSQGALGDGFTTPNSVKPLAVAGGLTFAKLALGWSHTCALTSAGAAYCWGDNNAGELGDGTEADIRTTPTAVTGELTFSSVTAGFSHTCGVTTVGAAYCWGDNGRGQLGDGLMTRHNTPTPVFGERTFAILVAGDEHTCGLTTGGAAYCWGRNNVGQLGDGTMTDHITPEAVAGELTFTSLGAGHNNNCGLTSGGATYCWGTNFFGQLGDGTTTTSTTPVAVVGELLFASLSVGGQHACGRTSGGVAYCWGYNETGLLGNGTLTTRSTPGAVSGGITFASLAAGDSHMCGQTSSGTAYCWGDNGGGKLGDGTMTNRTTPAAVSSP